MRRPFLAVFLVMLAPPALAAEASFLTDPAMSVSQRYGACLSLAQRDPQLGFDSASAWLRHDGEIHAAHCRAVALTGLHRYAEAAEALSLLVRQSVDATLKLQLLIQAGNAFMMAEQPGNALPLLSQAIEMSPGNIDALTDRARARAMRRDWNGAQADLTQALRQDPTRADLYVLRGSARHALGQKDAARADINEALELVPGYAEALVERGAMRLESGDRAGARADWESVVKKAPDSDTADSARARLSAMGVKAN